ncbi:hypothetical protein G7Y79_00002g008330 [Physcia stellaris]|nr:hypothetical protein G7Y79_00002g008330 [Physcia stellaris]
MPGHVAASIEDLRSTIASLEGKLHQLREELAALESEELRPTDLDSPEGPEKNRKLAPNQLIRHWNPRLEFTVEEYKRYGRQMIIPGFGLQGQLLLRNARVLIVGVGGLGCPAAAYLAGAGVGKIGLVDGDTVEISNLHRQIIHSSNKIGQTKVESAVEYLRQLNPKSRYIQYPLNLSSANALEIFDEYDIILDCTDQPQSRYLVSDAAVLSKKLLITASATITQGQLMTFGNMWDGQPCYRCVFPKPPSPETVQSCSDSGILGPAVGVMGVLMASQVIKMLTQVGILPDHCRYSAEAFYEMVRDGCLNLPYSIIDRAIREPGWLAKERDENRASNRIWQVEKQMNSLKGTGCFFVCRYGNDSQKAVDYFVNNMNKEFDCFSFTKYDEPGYKPLLNGNAQTVFPLPPHNIYIGDVKGGLQAWSKVDPTFPEY